MYIAYREKKCVDLCLNSIKENLELVSDIPAGTGKLSDVHTKHGYEVIAGDISADMLKEGIMKHQWDRCKNVVMYIQTDITDLDFKENIFDCFICLRLMHRVPDSIKKQALLEIKRVTKGYLIVSTGIFRKSISTMVNGKRSDRVRLNLDKWERILNEIGHIEKHIYVSKIFSNEIITLLNLSK
ncbi:MAG: class I SAM-dependent methyltransferase [Cyclobacteriaceae bacterium]|nr:class I SAM-dependent methyltransferase [Cyclobacteriaceae bacterium]